MAGVVGVENATEVRYWASKTLRAGVVRVYVKLPISCAFCPTCNNISVKLTDRRGLDSLFLL